MERGRLVHAVYAATTVTMLQNSMTPWMLVASCL
jgi:hypothetical protein